MTFNQGLYTVKHRVCIPPPLGIKKCETWFSGHASTYAQDAAGDCIVPGAFAKTLHQWMTQKGRFPHVYLEHHIDTPIGVCVELKEDPKGLFVRGKLIDDFPETKIALDSIQKGPQGVSIGFFVDRSYMRNRIRYITELSLKEISFVRNPCNTQAYVRLLAPPAPSSYQHVGHEVERALSQLKQHVHSFP